MGITDSGSKKNENKRALPTGHVLICGDQVGLLIAPNEDDIKIFLRYLCFVSY